MHAIIYARTSTREQESIPLQVDACREYATRRGWSVLEVITEQVSGAASNRPGRARALQLAKRGPDRVVLVWRLDRWGRSAADLLITLDDLASHGAAFASISEALDLSTPLGRMAVGMLAVFAQFTRELIGENVRAGIESYRRRNSDWGRPATAATKSEEARALRASGLSIRQIANRLGISPASVQRLVGSPPRNVTTIKNPKTSPPNPIQFSV